MPKYMTLQVAAPPDGHVLDGVRLYRAAKPFSRMSLPGRPPVPCCQSQPDVSRGSLEEPPVKVVPVLAPWATHSNGIVEGWVPVVVEHWTVPVGVWLRLTCSQTRSQSSGPDV